ncbi:MAG: hypothetical protein JWQ66_4437 [Mucilaginibacter sp.]|nr:hypothetical protein [Mucilaginibacter sp.]
MPAYNAAVFIEEAIDSVLNQSCQSWELIVINDGSTDNTKEIVEAYQLREHRVKLINQVNKGLGAARNSGMECATGEWIAFLDADDSWTPEKLWKQYLFISGHAEIDVLFSDGYTKSNDAPVNLYYHFSVAKGYFKGAEMYKRLFAGNQIPVLSCCVKKEWIEKIGKQYEDKDKSGSEDWDYWLRLAYAGASFYGMTDRLFIYRLHSANMSARTLEQRFSSAMVLIKNYHAQTFSRSEQRQFLKNNLLLHRDLQRAGKNDKATILYLAAEEVRKTNDDKSQMKLSVVFWSALFIFPGLKAVLKQNMKKAILKSIELLFFMPYRKYIRHAHNISIQYLRWQLGNRLETKGAFFISRKANVNVTTPTARFITYGMYINDFTQINLSGNNAYLFTGRETTINRFCNFNIWEGKLIIGNNVLFNNYCSVNCMEEIRIGDDTWIGEGVRFYDHNHHYADPATPFSRQGMRTGKIEIGRNCWIGSNTVILQSVSIGDNCIIGANNLIYKSVPASTIVKATAMENLAPLL